jgi:pimeloyl-ACP methyl ester carboxylesterase
LDYLEKTVSAQDGLRLYVRDYRPTKVSGRTVFCLSGLTRNSADFDELAPILRDKGHRVVTLDYRGRGQSDYDANWSNYVPETYVSDIFQVSAALGLHDCIMIGTSLGGLLSMAMCVVSPGLVHSVLLNDVGPDLDEKGIEKIVAYTSDGTSVASLDEAVEKLKSYYKGELGFVDKDWRHVAKKTYKMESGRYVPNWDVKIAQAISVSPKAQETKDLWPYFMALGERPVLVLRGKESSVFRHETYEKMCGLLPNISGLELENVGHAPTLGEDKALAAISDFITQ